jgi:hypothetical protein
VVSTAIAMMPANLTERVVAVVLYGSGDGSSILGSLREKTIANCAPGDFVSRSLLMPLRYLLRKGLWIRNADSCL